VELAELNALRQAASIKLDEQAARAVFYQQYYDNEAGIIALMDTKERETFRAFLAESNANWCEVIANAVAERLTVTGFRFGNTADTAAAWTIWQASSMDADAELVQTDAIITGQSLVLVQADEDNPTGVTISVESPVQACVVYVPGNRRKRLAGYKRYREPGETSWTEWLITADEVATWPPRADRQRPVIEPNPTGVIGLIEIVPQPRTLGPGRSELVSAISFQDRINTTIFNRCVAGDFGAYRQVWATGIKLAREVIKTEDGGEVTKVQAPFQMGVNRLLTNENAEGKFGSLPPSDLAGYIASTDQDVTMLAAATQTPMHYLTGQLVNLSADAIRAAEAGLVAKVRRRSLHIGEAWEETIRTAFTLTGRPGATDVQAETQWADFETRSIGQLVDSLVKMRTLGVPVEALWERYGATQQEIERWRGLAAAELETKMRELAAAQAATRAGNVPVPEGGQPA
jgi:hypothetical protein